MWLAKEKGIQETTKNQKRKHNKVKGNKNSNSRGQLIVGQVWQAFPLKPQPPVIRH